jgi:hypothetical protein
MVDDDEKGLPLNPQTELPLALVSRARSNTPPPEAEKKQSIKFKDSIGRNYSLPFKLCTTWNVSIPT